MANPDVLSDARRQMSFLLELTGFADRIESAARDYVRSQVERSEYRWQPGFLWAQEIENIRHLVELQKRGRGAILNFMHYGRYEGAFTALARAGAVPHLVMRDDLLGAQASHIARQHAYLCGKDTVVVPSTAGFGAMQDVLRDGNLLAIAFDVVGTTPVTFAGRRVGGRSGVAHLALTTGAPVVPMTLRRESDDASVIEIGSPVEPQDFDNAEAILQHLATLHERAILRYPGWANVPIKRWTLDLGS